MLSINHCQQVTSYRPLQPKRWLFYLQSEKGGGKPHLSCGRILGRGKIMFSTENNNISVDEEPKISILLARGVNTVTYYGYMLFSHCNMSW
jgi:hypothetical protein